jgi:hypothetical protein
MKPITSYVGLDVHKSTISVAIDEDGRRGEVRHYGVIENRADLRSSLRHGSGVAESDCASAMKPALVAMAFIGC